MLFGFNKGTGTSQAQFSHQSVLKGAVGPLHPSLRLRAVGEHLRHTELPHGAAELGWLSVVGNRRFGDIALGTWLTEHNVAVAV